MIAAHDEKKEKEASGISGVSSDLGIGQSLDPDKDALTPEIKAALPESDLEQKISDPKDSADIPKRATSVAGVADTGGIAAVKTVLPSASKSTPIDAVLNPDAEANANRSTGTKITNTIGNIGGVGLAAAGIGGAAVLGTTIAAAAGDSKANDIAGSIFGAGVDGVNAGSDALKVGSWANSDAWKAHDFSKGHDYSTAEKLGSGAYIGGGLSAAMGGISVITGGLDLHNGIKREGAAKKAGDTAGVTLGNESKWRGAQSVVTGVAGIGSGTAKIAAVASGSAAALGVAGGLGAVGSVVSLYQGGKMLTQDLKGWFKTRNFTPVSKIGEKWNNYVKSKKNKRMALSALKMVGAGLGIAAAIMGTVAGAGLPLLIAGGLIAGGMGIAKLSRSISNNKKISAAKAKMRDDGKYNNEYTEKKSKKWYHFGKSKPELNKSEKSDIADENKIKKGSAEELEEIKQTQLAQKRAKPGNEEAESKFSVARGIKQVLKKPGGIKEIMTAVGKVKQMLDDKTAEQAAKKKADADAKAAQKKADADAKAAQKKADADAKAAQKKAAADAKAAQKKAAPAQEPGILSKFWSSLWGEKATSTSGSTTKNETSPVVTVNPMPMVSAQKSDTAPAPITIEPESIAPNTIEEPAVTAPIVPVSSDVAKQTATLDSESAKPAEDISATANNPSPTDEEVFDAYHISQKIGVSPEEAVSASGEELIEKRLSVTNSL